MVWHWRETNVDDDVLESEKKIEHCSSEAQLSGNKFPPREHGRIRIVSGEGFPDLDNEYSTVKELTDETQIEH